MQWVSSSPASLIGFVVVIGLTSVGTSCAKKDRAHSSAPPVEAALKTLRSHKKSACECKSASCTLLHIDAASDLGFSFPKHVYPKGPLSDEFEALLACGKVLIDEELDEKVAPGGEGVSFCGFTWKHSARVANCFVENDTDIESLSQLSELENLGFQGMGRPADLRPLVDLKKLRFLILDNVAVGDLEPLRATTNLERLTIVGGDVKDLGPLEGHKNLERITLWATEVTSLRPLHNLPALKVLGLADHNISGAALDAFRRAQPNVVIQER